MEVGASHYTHRGNGPALRAVLGFALLLPTVGTGFCGDHREHQAKLQKACERPPPAQGAL